ncbi:MAG: glycosyltransferase [Bacillota bacterium]|nr:glycosyltransferase [Bacillota bacterium]
MNKLLGWILQSLFASVKARRGAFASSLGILLGLLPLHGERLLILFAVSILFRLNIIAILLGMIIPIFIPLFKSMAFLVSYTLEGHALTWEGIKFWLFSTNSHLFSTMPFYSFLGRLVIGILVALIFFPVFGWFYNSRNKLVETEKKGIFVDPSRRRWTLIKRVGIGFLAFSLLITFSFIESINRDPSFPFLHLNGRKTVSSIIPISEKIKDESLVKRLKKEEMIHPTFQLDYKKHHSKFNKIKGSQEVYGFYVNWDENSKESLKKNIHSLSVVVPEWLQLKTDLTYKSSVDPTVIALAKAHNVQVMPLINNFINNNWDQNVLHQLFKNPAAEDRLVKSLVDFVKKNHFSGINIDFEAINQGDKTNLTQFMEKLTSQFHQNSLKVTMDVSPNGPEFDYDTLSKMVDRIIVMLYDEHYSTSAPGPIASDNWIKQNLNSLNIPSNKLIVSLGNYGYDYNQNSKDPADTVTFGDLMDMGSNTLLDIHWDHATGNPYLRYKDGEDQHIIWFLDAATFYNQMKISMDNGVKGIAVWRLGSEDPSIWKLMNKHRSFKNPAKALKRLLSTYPVQYSGNGEILKITSTSKQGKRSIQMDTNKFINDEQYKEFPKPFKVERFGKPKGKEVVLTFDDGPDPVYTPQILHILDYYHIKASFFIVGENAELHPELIDRLFKDGQEIGNHTFTHPNVASVSPIRTKMELNANQRLFQEITGHSMTMFRPPYVADAEPNNQNELLPILRGQELGYTMVGELIDPEDWQRPSSNEILKRVLKQLPNGNIILLHDAGGDRSHTVQALPKIIKALKQQGYTFTTIGHLIGKSHQEMMPSALKDSQYYVYDKAVFLILHDWREGLTILFLSAICLGIIRLLLLVFLSRRQIKNKKEIPNDAAFTPFVSVVIAAYNEEKVICKTIDSILDSDYPTFEIIIVDDGSKDGTAQVIEKKYKDTENVSLIKKVNGGKSSAVNQGFKEAKGDIVVALDADTIISNDAISLLIRHFKDEKVAAVSGNVKVGNKGNLLTNWQHIEYVTGFNLERRAFSELNCITVVPGAIGAWKKEVVEKVGYFKEDTLAEDTDITLTLLESGYKVEFEERSFAYTEAPEDLKSLAKQRFRWTYGTLQCLWKHKNALFNLKNKSLGFIGLPNMWIYQYLYQPFSPLADILFILALFGDHPKLALIGFIGFYLLDFFSSLYAFHLEKESPRPLIHLFLQRILYKQVMVYVVLKSIIYAVSGVTVGWNKLKRNGNVNNVKVNKRG